MSKVPPWDLKREMILKDEQGTDPEFGCLPTERTLRNRIKFGVINIDKPPGPTSHEVVAWVKRLLELDKAGHGGTLVLCKEIPK
jgi:H/ACA ribonucleoprotein complex subunit 4